MSKLDGKVAIVTGASKGIGAGIAKALAKEGAAVIVNYVTGKQESEKVVSAIKSAGGKAIAVSADVSKSADAKALVAAALSNFGSLDILVNNAGIYEFSPLETITEEQFHKLFNINVLGPILVTQAALSHFSNGASIINIGSNATSFMPATMSLYAGTKGAIDTITGVLAKELAGRNIRVNAINPGPTETEGTAQLLQSDMAAQMLNQIPLARFGKPEDIAAMTVFLASADSGWVTGERFLVSGGMR